MKNDIKQIRQFGVTLSVGLTALRFILFFRKGHQNLWLLYVAAALFIIALIYPKFLKPIFIVWMKAAHIIGKIISSVILGVFFYLVITPAGLIMKIMKRDSLSRKFDKGAKTYWIRRDPKLSDPKRIERQF